MPLLRSRVAVAVVALFATVPGCAFRRGPAAYLERRGVEIAGAKALSADQVAEAIDVTGGASGAPLEEHQLDTRRVLWLYRSMGYPEARIDVRRMDDGPTGKLRVDVVEGRFARVVRVKLEGLDDVAEAAAWLPLLPLRAGSGFDPEAYEHTRDAVVAALCAIGYPRASVVHGADVAPGTLDVRAWYLASPGPRGEACTVGTIFVAGASRVPRDRVRAEAEQVLAPGGPFDLRALVAIRERLLRLGAYHDVTVRANPDPKRNTVNVVVAVQERR